MAETDRTAHEVRTLVEALYLGGTYDQLSMPALAAFETLGGRLMTIVGAFSSSANGALIGAMPSFSQARSRRMTSSTLSSDRGLPKKAGRKSSSSQPAQRSKRRKSSSRPTPLTLISSTPFRMRRPRQRVHESWTPLRIHEGRGGRLAF